MRFLKNTATKHWGAIIIILAFIALLINTALFYPGYLSPDSSYQLCQALYKCQLTTWHPVTTVLIWRGLINLTGHISSMLLLQLFMLWTALLILAYVLWVRTKSIKLSLLVLSVGILPNVVNISGVIWKDNQMAFALLLATSIALTLKLCVSKMARWLLFGTALIFLMYATTVLHNGFASSIPITFLVIHESKFIPSRRMKLMLTLLIVCGSIVTLSIINSFFNASAVPHVEAATMVGDIINTVPPNKIEVAHIPLQLKTSLFHFSQCSPNTTDKLVNSYWACGNDNDRAITGDKQYRYLSNFWWTSIYHQPVQYCVYKIESFMIFLFPGPNQYIWQNGITNLSNDGVHVKDNKLLTMNYYYVNNFGRMYFSFAYQAWFWILVGIWLLLQSVKLQRYKVAVMGLATSSLLNILSFLPASVTPDYRYIYWSVLASMTGLLLVYDEKRPLILLRYATNKRRDQN